MLHEVRLLLTALIVGITSVRCNAQLPAEGPWGPFQGLPNNCEVTKVVKWRGLQNRRSPVRIRHLTPIYFTNISP